MTTSLVFNVYKEPGMTSRQVLDRFKKTLPKGLRKIGHLGTLDPFADGVLLIATDSATRLSDIAHEYLPKTYRAVGKFGQKTSTGDFWKNAEVTSSDELFQEKITSLLKNKDFEVLLKKKFEGIYWQTPHQVSATKHKGRPLYKYAREGILIKKDPVKRFIHNLTIHSLNFNEMDFSVTVSSGTYIRSLFEDIAEWMGTCGALFSLTRKAIGEQTLEDCFRFEGASQGITLDKILSFPKVHLSSDLSVQYKNGRPLSVENLFMEKNLGSPYYWVYNFQDELLGLGVLEEGLLKVKFNIA